MRSPFFRLSRTWRDRLDLSSSLDRSGTGRLRRSRVSEVAAGPAYGNRNAGGARIAVRPGPRGVRAFAGEGAAPAGSGWWNAGSPNARDHVSKALQSARDRTPPAQEFSAGLSAVVRREVPKRPVRRIGHRRRRDAAFRRVAGPAPLRAGPFRSGRGAAPQGWRDGGAKDMVKGAQFDIMARLKAMAAPGKRCMKNIAFAARPCFGTVLPMPSDGGAAQGHARSLLRVFCGRPPALRQIRVDAWVHPIFFWLGGC